MISPEWRCSWSSADRRCSNYIWVIDNVIAYKGASCIRGFTVFLSFRIEEYGRNQQGCVIWELYQSLCNLTGPSAAALPRSVSNFKAIWSLSHTITRLRDFARFGGKTSYHLLNKCPVSGRNGNAPAELCPYWHDMLEILAKSILLQIFRISIHNVQFNL